MPQTCHVCPRQDRERLDTDLLRGVPARTISAQCGPGGPSYRALLRHKAHVTERVAKAHEAAEVAASGRLLRKLEALETRAEGLLTKAERKGQFGPAAAFVRELRELLKLFGEISGELKGGGVTLNILASPEWSSLQRKILDALEPFPEARLSVARALLPAGNGGGPDA